MIQAFALLTVIVVVLPTPANAGRPHLYQQRLDAGRALVEVPSAYVAEVLPHCKGDIESHDPIVDICGIEEMTGFLHRLLVASTDRVTIVAGETLFGDLYSTRWIMSGMFKGALFSAPVMSIIKFGDGTPQSYDSRDYCTEGGVMTGVPELVDPVEGFRVYYRWAVDPTFECPFWDAPISLTGNGKRPFREQETGRPWTL